MLFPRSVAVANLARASSRLPQVSQRRGMGALKNWKRPSMEEYGVPTEPWAQVNAKRQTRSAGNQNCR